MRSRPLDVYGLGQCCLDVLGTAPVFPQADAKCELAELALQGGGPTATALVALARWGASCAFAGVIGDDLFGTIIAEGLAAERIDTTGLLVREGFSSQFSLIVAGREQATRNVFWRRPTGSPPRPDEIDRARIREARVLHTDGLFIEAALAAAREARQSGTTVVVDAGSLREGMLELAGLSDCFLASEPFARTLVGNGGPREACRRLGALGPEVVGVTLGGRGYVALAGDREIEGAAYPVEAIDTTGCGDLFHAGFVHGLLQGWSVEACLDFGAWAASRVALRLGGRTGIPPADHWPGSGA
jgi:ribokinase